VIAKPIAFNVVPHIDEFMDNGYTKEEMKMVWETRKILGDESIQVNPTAVRVPVFFGHSEAVHIETRRKMSAREVRALLENAPGVTVIDEARLGGYPTAVTEAAGHDPVYVGRIREDMSCERGINLWVVSDNIRKGAATEQRADRRGADPRISLSPVSRQPGRPSRNGRWTPDLPYVIRSYGL
jgi:aspartate-semialdehyde dehydrogenase